MSSTETENTEAQETNGAASAAKDEGGSLAGKALKVGALAAAAGTAAFAASKAITSGGGEGETKQKSEGGSENGSSRGRVSMEQIVSAIGSSRWDVLRDLVVPFAENGARSAGSFVATSGPDIVSETLVPKFIEGFEEGKKNRDSE